MDAINKSIPAADLEAEDVTTICVAQEWRMTAITLEAMAVDLEHRARELRRQAQIARRHAARYDGPAPGSSAEAPEKSRGISDGFPPSPMDTCTRCWAADGPGHECARTDGST